MTGRQIFVRSALTVTLPLILLWAFTEKLIEGMRAAFKFAWLEVRLNIAAYHKQMERDDY